ncbi:MAG: glycoside hydrolase family 2 [Clostridia bacterium]|nr:glycoside hydrolase family 2 [Clostridia bacterium]
MGDIPHAEHPRPQAKRKNWLCLNGIWNFYKENQKGEKSYEGEILVPFSPETLLSGLDENFKLLSGETLVYERKFYLSDEQLHGVGLLHFDAVDEECEGYINGEKVGCHKGGFTAFSFDVTPFLHAGENTVKVICRDEGTRNGGARGKQSDRRGGIWYTPQSGIWQSVWLEFMPKGYIETFRIVTNAEEKTVTLSVQSKTPVEITVFDQNQEIIRETFEKEITLTHPFALWSPENPKLYDFTLKNGAGDEISSYFGVRSFGITTDKTGKKRLSLNGKPYFFNGVLDQGYWSDGMLTYPSDQAAYDELKMLKDMGFNTVRKHIKIEPMRWYYHCDQLGLIVWQDFVNGGGAYKFTHVAAFPFLGFHHKDDDYKYFARQDERAREEFIQSSLDTLHQLFNCVSIGLWVPFNEGWGQFDSKKITELVQSVDSTRIVDSVSGWHDQGVGNTTLKSLHIYYTKLKVPKDPRPVVLSEFGGYSMQTTGHVFDESKEFGYKKFKTQEDLAQAVETLYLEKILPLIKQGLCGCIYTQVSDVEEEINGLITYDRKIIKLPAQTLRPLFSKLQAEANEIE